MKLNHFKTGLCLVVVSACANHATVDTREPASLSEDHYNFARDVVYRGADFEEKNKDSTDFSKKYGKEPIDKVKLIYKLSQAIEDQNATEDMRRESNLTFLEQKINSPLAELLKLQDIENSVSLKAEHNIDYRDYYIKEFNRAIADLHNDQTFKFKVCPSVKDATAYREAIKNEWKEYSKNTEKNAYQMALSQSCLDELNLCIGKKHEGKKPSKPGHSPVKRSFHTY